MMQAAERGFTLIEVLVASTLTAVLALGVMQILGVARNGIDGSISSSRWVASTNMLRRTLINDVGAGNLLLVPGVTSSSSSLTPATGNWLQCTTWTPQTAASVRPLLSVIQTQTTQSAVDSTTVVTAWKSSGYEVRTDNPSELSGSATASLWRVACSNAAGTVAGTYAQTDATRIVGMLPAPWGGAWGSDPVQCLGQSTGLQSCPRSAPFADVPQQFVTSTTAAVNTSLNSGGSVSLTLASSAGMVPGQLIEGAGLSLGGTSFASSTLSPRLFVTQVIDGQTVIAQLIFASATKLAFAVPQGSTLTIGRRSVSQAFAADASAACNVVAVKCVSLLQPDATTTGFGVLLSATGSSTAISSTQSGTLSAPVATVIDDSNSVMSLNAAPSVSCAAGSNSCSWFLEFGSPAGIALNVPSSADRSRPAKTFVASRGMS